ncbi:MAG: VanZ family protein [Chloroflexi bacterium]|nr:VanZ family protein [Chloroflexota bacterium]MBI3732755.1 VanZ family protein [Chloroflexota bacterium]
MIRKITRAWFDWVLVICWMGAIYYFSDQLDPPVPGLEYWSVRKLMHSIAYALLFVLWLRALGHISGDALSQSSRRTWRLAIAATTTYAISDELHQHWVGRDGNALDVVIDSMLPFLAWVLMEARKATRWWPQKRLDRP